jgi:Relaxase/Mobilisation nuclease domain
MISKLVKGQGFKGCSKYIYSKPDAEEIAANNLFTNKPETRASEMRAVASSAATMKPVFHASLSLPAGQKASQEQWKLAAETYLSEMGFELEQTQYMVVRHSDSAHDHVHILANRIMLNGKILSDKKDFKRSHQATRAVEIAANLPAFEPSAPAVKEGKANKLRTIIDTALFSSRGNLEAFKSNLALESIELKIAINTKTNEPFGVNFIDHSDANRYWRGSQIGKDYSLKSLQNKGLKLDPPQPVSHLSTTIAKTFKHVELHHSVDFDNIGDVVKSGEAIGGFGDFRDKIRLNKKLQDARNANIPTLKF